MSVQSETMRTSLFELLFPWFLSTKMDSRILLVLSSLSSGLKEKKITQCKSYVVCGLIKNSFHKL